MEPTDNDTQTFTVSKADKIAALAIVGWLIALASPVVLTVWVLLFSLLPITLSY